jgi:MinD-like ATPase involved in chromosome partitioning or flagellar assembly
MSTDSPDPASADESGGSGRPTHTPVAVPRRSHSDSGPTGWPEPAPADQQWSDADAAPWQTPQQQSESDWQQSGGWSNTEQAGETSWPQQPEQSWPQAQYEPPAPQWGADEPQQQQQWGTGEQPAWQGSDQQEPTGWPQGQPVHQPVSGSTPVVRPAGGPPGLNDESLLTHRRQQSSRGWRRAVSAITLGAVKPGLSATEIAEAEQMRAIRTPIRGCHRIGVVSLKGGIGKTTTAAGLGLALATTRGDGVIAVDANPDAGTLSDRLVGAPPDAYSGAEWVGAHVRATDDTWIAPRSVRDLLAAVSADEIGSATDVMRYVSIAGRLHVLASEQDPETSEAFNAQEYRTTAEVISAFYSVMITDTGTGLLHSAMAGMLSMADSLVIIAAPSVDGASRAAKTLDWLDAHHYGNLVARAVVAVSHTRPRAQNVDMKVLDAHFSARCRALVHIPYDPHLVAGSVIRWTEMSPATRSAFLRLAASVSEDFREGWN